MNIKEMLQKNFPRHKIHHEEAKLFTDEKYFIMCDKRKLCLQLHSDVYLVYVLDTNTVFPFPDFTKVEKAIDFMRWLYEYTKWLKSSK